MSKVYLRIVRAHVGLSSRAPRCACLASNIVRGLCFSRHGPDMLLLQQQTMAKFFVERSPQVSLLLCARFRQ